MQAHVIFYSHFLHELLVQNTKVNTIRLFLFYLQTRRNKSIATWHNDT